jgi:hypothetical protein
VLSFVLPVLCLNRRASLHWKSCGRRRAWPRVLEGLVKSSFQVGADRGMRAGERRILSATRLHCVDLLVIVLTWSAFEMAYQSLLSHRPRFPLAAHQRTPGSWPWSGFGASLAHSIPPL